MSCVMKKVFVLCLGVVGAGSLFAESSNYPAFSWDRVPVCLHFGSTKRMTNAQVETAARLSNFICLEKAHGRSTNSRHPERVAGQDAKRIRKINPDAKVLMYWNTLIAWPFTSYNRDFAESHPEDWILRDRETGEPLLKSTIGNRPVYQYNLLNEDVRTWWAQTAGDAVKKLGFDGLFIDAISQSKRPLWLLKGWGKDKEDDLDAAAVDMLRKVREVAGEDRLLIYNGFRTDAAEVDGGAAAGTEFLPYSDGAMIEHFDGFSSKTKEDVLAYWQMAEEAAVSGKIVIYKGWPDQDIHWLDKDFMAKSQAEKERIARSKLTYPLACYLIGARENSYFCYGWGYDVDDGQLIEYPEYGKRLGAPEGEAVRDGWIFRRSFRYAKVWVDLEKREGKIQWLDQ